MIDIRMSKAVRRVIVLESDPHGGSVATTVYRRKRKKKKKGSAGVRDIERIVSAMGSAQQAMADDFMRRHKRSNRKRKDGWLYDLGPNVFKVGGKGMRKAISCVGL